jgi:hypothetical protein
MVLRLMPDGSQIVLAAGADSIHSLHRGELAAWSGWRQLPVVDASLSDLATTFDDQGRLMVTVVGTDLWRTRELGLGLGWQPWTPSQHSVGLPEQAVAVNGRERMHLFVAGRKLGADPFPVQSELHQFGRALAGDDPWVLDRVWPLTLHP